MIPAVQLSHRDEDNLRMLALSRIPRCEHCPRFAVLSRVVEEGWKSGVMLPSPPADCRHRVCDPMAFRLTGADRGDA